MLACFCVRLLRTQAKKLTSAHTEIHIKLVRKIAPQQPQQRQTLLPGCLRQTIMAADCCLLHVDGFEGPLTLLTKTTLAKFIESRRKWLLLSGQMKDIAERSLEFISDEDVNNETSDYDWKYHIQCYRRFTDKQKIDRAVIQHEKRKAEVDEGCSSSSAAHGQEPTRTKRTRLATQTEVSGAKCVTTAGRNSFVLPRICLICKKSDYFYTCQVSLFIISFLTIGLTYPKQRHREFISIDS